MKLFSCFHSHGQLTRLAGLALVSTAISSSAWAQILVTPTTPGGIQGAINASPNGGTIIVGSGTYNLQTQRLDLLNKNLTITGQLPVGSAILDGGGVLGASLMRITGGQTSATVIENLSFKAGHAAEGGAFYVSGAAPTLRNNFITSCTATARGGGMYLQLHGGQMTVSRCQFTSNVVTGSSGDGAGIYAVRGGALCLALPLDLYVQQCEFITNSNTRNGGGLFVDGTFTNPCPLVVKVEKTKFRDNRANRGGGVLARFSKLEILRGEFVLNQAVLDTSGSSGFGGGLASENNYILTVTDSTFSQNSAAGTAAKGGGAFVHDIAQLAPSGATMRNNLFTGNSAIAGGGLGIVSATVNTNFTTIAGNNAPAGPGIPGVGGGVSVENQIGSQQANFFQSIIWSNTAGGSPVAFQNIFNLSLCRIWKSNVANATPVVPPPGFPANINTPPQFATGYSCNYSPVAGYFLNQSLSPCVNFGMAAYGPPMPTGWTTNPTGAADTGTADIGFHHPPANCQ